MKVLITGAAGFIGYHTAQALLTRGDEVIGVDNLNDYYDVALKQARLDLLASQDGFRFHKIDLADRNAMEQVFAAEQPDGVVNLAAQPGVRYSLKNPHAYIDTNIVGFLHVLEGCRHNKVKHLVFASSSSVYGANTLMPYSIHHNVDHPLSLYGASKKSNELMAHTYAHLYQLPVTGLRFFTVYGPWGRPDMSPMLFAERILSGQPIDIFNYGQHARDFTYIDDITEGVIRTLDFPARPDEEWSSLEPDPGSSSAPYRLYNIGNNQPVELMRFIEILERALGRTAIKNFLPMQPGDVHKTYADIEDLADAVGFTPNTRLEDGIGRFVDWYRTYYKV